MELLWQRILYPAAVFILCMTVFRRYITDGIVICLRFLLIGICCLKDKNVWKTEEAATHENNKEQQKETEQYKNQRAHGKKAGKRYPYGSNCGVNICYDIGISQCGTVVWEYQDAGYVSGCNIRYGYSAGTN